jgi:hypothetical protein
MITATSTSSSFFHLVGLPELLAGGFSQHWSAPGLYIDVEVVAGGCVAMTHDDVDTAVAWLSDLIGLAERPPAPAGGHGRRHAGGT